MECREGSNDPPRAELADQLRASIETNQLTIVTGAVGLGQVASIRFACESLRGWSALFADGRWLTSGYLSGLHELIAQSFAWAQATAPDLVARHEQTLKRIWPTLPSAAYRVPKDLTNSSDREERTRFYHHEYQNKLLVGLAEFLRDVMNASDRSVILIIKDAARLSPTSRSLIAIILRQSRSARRLRFVLLDYDGMLFIPQAVTIRFAGYAQQEFDRHLDLAGVPCSQREMIYALSRGNLSIGRALRHCFERGIAITGDIGAESVVDFYLASLSAGQRTKLALEHVRSGFAGDLIARRNAETIAPALLDEENERQHAIALDGYRRGEGPLIFAHVLAINDKSRRIEALVELCEVLMAIGLYDTWFCFFAPMFADPDLRAYGGGDGPVNGLFINAAFVLYSMGNARVSAPCLEEFLERFPESHFIPTALYAQSMTFGRYQIPVDLDRAEAYATKNIDLIERHFRDHKRYTYIKVFAENAYAYIKARQGRFAEALELCERGNADILAVYGESSYRLHRSILIYNTSQIYEIIGDYAHAAAQLKEAIACDPYYAEYQNDLGNLLAKTDGREREALEAYARAIALSPPYYEAHLNRGILRAQIGDLAGALADFERTLEIKPQEWRALREIGNARLATGDAAGALEAYARALDHEERDADLQANAGLACSELGDDEAAMRHYRSAIAINLSHATAHNNLAAELAKRGRYNEALQHAHLAVRHGNDPDFIANITAIKALRAAAG
jgi:tetratricopeptide (TPR) repeat protein